MAEADHFGVQIEHLNKAKSGLDEAKQVCAGLP